MGLKYVIGDVTDPQIGEGEIVFIPHVCNNMRRFGAGVSGAIGKKWPDAEKVYRESPLSIQLGAYVTKQVASNLYILHMIAQHDTKARGVKILSSEGEISARIYPIRYGALAHAMIGVREFVRLFQQETSIAAPRFGSGLSGGDWNTIESMIFELWIDHGIDVTIYTPD